MPNSSTFSIDRAIVEFDWVTRAIDTEHTASIATPVIFQITFAPRLQQKFEI